MRKLQRKENDGRSFGTTGLNDSGTWEIPRFFGKKNQKSIFFIITAVERGQFKNEQSPVAGGGSNCQAMFPQTRNTGDPKKRYRNGRRQNQAKKGGVRGQHRSNPRSAEKRLGVPDILTRKEREESSVLYSRRGGAQDGPSLLRNQI